MKEMKHLTKHRYDYFLIWGNGIPHKKEILARIRAEDEIKILMITTYRPKSIARFVRKVYSYDYAPFKHLKAKTRYLLKSAPEIMLIFVRNENLQEVYRGQGAFRHIECDYIQGIKNEIRGKFNPRKNGQLTHEHVIHASDNESQVDHILKIIGIKEGLELLRNRPNPILELPYYLPTTKKFLVRNVKAKNIYCNLVRCTDKSHYKEKIPIIKTPHYACLEGDREAYRSYSACFEVIDYKSDYSLERFVELSRTFRYLEHPYATSYIITLEFDLNQYLILDGVHRASILRHRGESQFPVAILQ